MDVNVTLCLKKVILTFDFFSQLLTADSKKLSLSLASFSRGKKTQFI